MTVAEWLMTDEGQAWSYEHFDDATECHDIIEVQEDWRADRWWTDSATFSTGKLFRTLRTTPGWQDLRWNPDDPPEGGRRA